MVVIKLLEVLLVMENNGYDDNAGADDDDNDIKGFDMLGDEGKIILFIRTIRRNKFLRRIYTPDSSCGSGYSVRGFGYPRQYNLWSHYYKVGK